MNAMSEEACVRFFIYDLVDILCQKTGNFLDIYRT